MTKRERHGAILQLVRERGISTQQELTVALADLGYDVVQSTVSRDISELELVKVRRPDGRLVYAEAGTPDLDLMRDLQVALQRWAYSIEANEALVVIKTPAGFADPLAEVLDTTSHPLVLGTVAGDNTVLVVVAAGHDGVELRDALRAMVAGNSAGV